MILLELLALDNWHCISENIDIAKGKNELPLTLKKGWKQYKRAKLWQKKR